MNINLGDVLVLLILGGLMGSIVYKMIRSRRGADHCSGCAGCNCRGGCSACPRQ